MELRDGGIWVCEIGSNIDDDFQVQTKEFQIEIESESENIAACEYRELFVNTLPFFSSSPEALGSYVADAGTK